MKVVPLITIDTFGHPEILCLTFTPSCAPQPALQHHVAQLLDGQGGQAHRGQGRHGAACGCPVVELVPEVLLLAAAAAAGAHGRPSHGQAQACHDGHALVDLLLLVEGDELGGGVAPVRQFLLSFFFFFSRNSISFCIFCVTLFDGHMAPKSK